MGCLQTKPKSPKKKENDKNGKVDASPKPEAEATPEHATPEHATPEDATPEDVKLEEPKHEEPASESEKKLKDEKAMYEEFFADADTDNSGSLSLDELVAMLRKRGYKGDDDEIRVMFDTVDTSGDGKISQEEYLTAMMKQETDKHEEAAARYIFQSFDTDSSGAIDRSELKEAFEQMGKYFTDAEINRMMSAIDKDKDGQIEYEEFIKSVIVVKK